MHPLCDRLKTDHRNAMVLLDLFERELVKVAAYDDSSLEALFDVVHYMNAYSDKFHHPIEDLIVDALNATEQVASSTETRQTLDQLGAQHRSLEAAGSALKRTFELALGGDFIEREVLLEQSTQYARSMREHMDAEAESLFPLALSVLDNVAWEDVAKQSEEFDDPVFGEIVAMEFARLRTWLNGSGSTGRDLGIQGVTLGGA